MVDDKPDLVQRFLDASIEGWQSYLHGDPAPGNALMKKDNPEMTDALLAYGRAALRDRNIIEPLPGQGGIGAMTDARWDDFLRVMQAQGVYPAGLDVRRAYTLRFLKGAAAK